MKIIRKLLDAVKSEKGQTIIEYALVVVLISLILIGFFLSADLETGLGNVGTKVSEAISGD